MAHSERKREVPARIMGPRLLLVVTVLALTLLGIVMVYSSSTVEALSSGKSTWSYMADQAFYALVGAVIALVAWSIPMRWWRGPLLWIVWGVTIVLLLATAFSGSSALGATRWLSIGPVSVQPSEFAKITFVLVGARIFDEYRQGRASSVRSVVLFSLTVLVPVLFLYKTQSDLGTTVIIVVGLMAVLWMGEMPMRYILAILAVGVVFVIASVVGTGYRSSRLAYLYPFSDHYDTTWQIDHSLWAFAEGGVFGVGLGNSSQKYLYLSEAETDFIYAIIGEELGLIGAVAVLVLFMLMLYAGMRIARAAADLFGAMVAGSLIIMIVFQAFLNIGCVIGIFPTTGKPLPFVSSGGSSLIASLAMIGLVLSVSKESAFPTIYERRRDDLRIVRVADEGRDGDATTRRQGRQRDAGTPSRRGSSGSSTSEPTRRRSRAQTRDAAPLRTIRG